MTQPMDQAQQMLADPAFYERAANPQILTTLEPEPVLMPSQTIEDNPFQ